MSEADLIRHRLRCRGVVQGVGFRPAVYRLAVGCGLGGYVRNDVDGVVVEVEGEARAVAAFEANLAASLPPLARLDEMHIETTAPAGDRAFAVQASVPGRRRHAIVPPDLAPCASCRTEMRNPRDRRWRYPFTTCTDCGPRFSLVRALPYDRERTSMAPFAMCPECAAEYGDPTRRRFHAEPLCCPRCGPRLWLEAVDGQPLGDGRDALTGVRVALAAGCIVAVQGTGGMQLACRADDGAIVQRLRDRKHRAGKPLALMVRDLAAARRLVQLRAEDEEQLASPRAPIVLAPRRAGAPIADAVAPGLGDLGVMLPTSPLHDELFTDATYDVLVMTSGNRSDEPICITHDDTRRRLSDIADCLLLHEREIVRRVDDSVVRTMPDGLGPCVVRRSRGQVPDALPLAPAAPAPVLALGGHLQTTACLAIDDHAFPSQHVGDLDTQPARAFLAEVATGLERFLEVEAAVLAADLHPDYASTWLAERFAQERGGRVVRVQHHLAHLAAVLGEHRALPRSRGEVAFGLILDGTGHGTDGTAWGCEWLVVDGALQWWRPAHGEALPLVGGETAVRQPWRVAAAALAAHGLGARLAELPLAQEIAPGQLDAIARLAGPGRWPMACGAGRLFEAAGALLGAGAVNRCEGDAAMRLEALAATAPPVPPFDEVRLDTTNVLPHGALLAAAARRVLDGEPSARVARGVHATFCRLAVELTQRVLPRGTRRVALGGGCLVNRLLAQELVQRFAAAGITALRPRELPPGDGGLSYGQSVVAAASLALGAEPRQIPCPDPE